MVDTCAGEFAAATPYFYSTYEQEDEADPLAGPKVIVLGSGPIRIGQGIEFDYSSVHAVEALRAAGIKAIVINNNPETVSTDYHLSDRLYFEPLRPSYVLGGRGMEIVYDDATLWSYVTRATDVSPGHPVLIDRFLDDAIEIDVDALYDGSELYLGGVMEHIEEAGIDSDRPARCRRSPSAAATSRRSARPPRRSPAASACAAC